MTIHPSSTTPTGHQRPWNAGTASSSTPAAATRPRLPGKHTALNTARRGGDEGGFSLIELLVVILIIGILAAIAIPSFLNQKTKAIDASAKELARTAETASETVATDNQGSYATVSPTVLNAVEATLPITVSATNAYLSSASGTSTSYTVTSTAVSGNTYTIANVSGTVTRTCTVAAAADGGGCLNSSW